MEKQHTVLLTGATGKIGKQLISALVKSNHNVIFTSRSSKKIATIENEYKNSATIVKGISVDLESVDLCNDLDAFFEQIELYPSVLINNARNIDYLKSDGETVSDASWIGEFKLGVTIPYKLSMHLSENGYLEKVINIASMYGVVVPNHALYENKAHVAPIHYGTIKAAMIHLTKELAVRLIDKNIIVNAISYGGVEGRVNEEFLQRYKTLCPQKKMLKEEEVSGSVLFLISNMSNSMVGHNLIVDGGWSLW